MNLYTYCYNNPCRYEDPSGNFGIIACTLIGVAVGGIYGGIKSYKESNKIVWSEVGKDAIKGGLFVAGTGFMITGLVLL